MTSERRHNGGFSLLEVLISLGIFSLTGAGFAASILMNHQFNRLSEERTEAQFAVEQVIDGLRVKDPTSLPHSGTDPVQHITVGDHTYDVYVTYCSIGTYCSSSTSIRTIHAEAKFNGKSRYAADTVFAQLE